MRYFLFIFFIGISVKISAQITADFNLPTGVCLEEQFQIENTSVNADRYEWDFCFEEFSSLTPNFESYINQGLSTPFETRIIEADTSFYLFVPNRTNNSIKRYHVSNDFETIYAESSLQNVSSFFQEPISIDIAHINGNWIGYGVDFTQSKVYTLNFGSDLDSDPTIQELPLNSISLNSPSRIKIETSQDSIFLFISNFGTAKLSKIVMDKADVNMPIVEEEYVIPAANQLASFDILKFNANEWLMLLGQVGGNNLIKLKFANSLNSDPSIESLSVSGDTYTKPSGPQLFKEGDDYYSLLVNRTGEFFRLDFGDDIDNIPSVTNYGIATGSNASWSLDVIKNDNSRFVGFFTKFNSSLAIKFSFDDLCDAIPVYSTNSEPIVNFRTSGTRSINLNAYNSSGEVSTISKSVLVNTNTAPTGQVNLNTAYCIANNIDFTINTSDDINSYLWEFGDGNNSTVSNPTYQYTTDGEYFITLEVENTDGCTNTFYDTLLILPEPQPEFTTSSAEYCTFESITFANETPFDFGENVEWSWNFNGEGSSTEENPSFTFESAGTKTITLEADVLGCVRAFQTTLEIINGPQPDFEYDQNCLGEAVQFSNLSTGADITGYQWDFDNGDTSTEENPQTIYNNAGNYTVKLTVSNASGCETSTTQNIKIFDQIVDSIMSTEAVEKLPFSLGVDWRNDFDSTQNITFQWDLNGEIQTTDTAEYTFVQGFYTVNLEITTSSNCIFTSSRTIEVQASENPTPEFNLPAEVCLEEQFQIENTSVNADRYEWDFCFEEFSSLTPNFESYINQGLSTPFETRIIEADTSFYLFVPNRTNNSIKRYHVSNDFETIYAESSLQNVSSFFQEPISIDIAHINGNWIGYGVDFTQSKVYTLNFGSDLDSDPTIQELPLNSISLNSPSRIKIETSQDSIFLFISNFGTAKLSKIVMDKADVNMPIVEEEYVIPAANQLASFDILKFNANEWLMLLGQVGGNNLIKLKFANSLNSDPSIESLSVSGDTYTKPSGPQLFKEGDDYYSLLVNRTGEFFRLDFGDDIDNIPSVTNYGIATGSNASWSLDVIKNDNSRFIGLLPAINSNGAIKVGFDDECSVKLPLSTEIAPDNKYTSSGTKSINLTATHPNGNTASITKEITVTNNQAPDITFTTGDNLCITNPIAFNSTSAADITSYSWDFGDGNTSTAENPNHTYTAAGTYAVKVSVTDANGCNNSFQDSIGVFEEPVPDFQATAQGSICSQKPIVFENLTTLPTDATFEWDLGDGSTSTVENPEHIYSEAGDYTVTQIIEMAGCLVERTKTITVNPGPAVAFQTANNCLGEILKFENTSQGEFLDSYQWDFGDGTQSTQANPSHSYDTAGVYNVQLTAFTTNGCDFTISQEVEIQPLALVNFDSEIAFAGQPTQFMEQVNIEESNVTDYFWDFGVLGTQSDVSTEASPQFTYPAEGSYNVTLQVTTSDGCTSSGSQQIVVNSAPNAAFEFEETCLGQTRLFSPLDTANSINHFWELQNNQGEILQTAQSAFFSYLFTEAGNYQLTYRQENESLCSQATTQTIEINEQPIPDFTWGTACVGELVSFENLTALNGNRLKNYNWSIEGTMFSSDLAPQYTFEESGNYQLTLEVETQGGCIQNISKNLLVSSKPTAFFELEQSIGAYPFALNLMMQDNPNEEIVEVFWILNEDTISNSSELSHTITEPGTYLLGLTVINEAGCKNEYYEQIKVREPSLDVSLSNLRIKKDQEFTSFILNISNRGSLVSERIDLTIDFGEYSLTESLEAQIYPEENRNFSLSTRLTDEQLRGLSKICISASPKAGERKDANPQNNRICTNIENGFKVMDIYPNPTINQFTIPLIIPENETITISMEDSNGRQVKFYNYSLEAGYNEVQIQRENLSPGIYFLRFRYQGQEKIKKIIFQ